MKCSVENTETEAGFTLKTDSQPPATAEVGIEWESRQARLNPYPFGASSITIVDIGAGLGIASLATIDVLAAWADVLAELGYRQLGISVKIISVEPDAKKQGPRQNMLGSLSSLLDRRSIAVDGVTDVVVSYPDPDCVQQVLTC